MDAIELVRLLGTEYTPEILHATEEPRTAQEVSDALGIPIATTYRRLNALADAELVRTVSPAEADAETEDGPTAYQRTVDDLRVAFESDTVEVTVQDRYTVSPRLRDLWRGLFGD